MSKFEKIIQKLLSGNDRNFEFNDLCNLLETLGFDNRIKGSHHIYFKEGITEIINLQPINKKAKPYQVKQVRELLIKYKLISFKDE
ncbi:MAG TPA: type II toxin-antitoxin system HicA family toxin [Chitinophagaceae bacterium]|jgi:predicted RNA binding protein YcfA (HicA-like mRNA interferase family)|nr:type II toxin-antitoxin system HicA family toxin [Chitinophagaceae bacterium]